MDPPTSAPSLIVMAYCKYSLRALCRSADTSPPSWRNARQAASPPPYGNFFSREVDHSYHIRLRAMFISSRKALIRRMRVRPPGSLGSIVHSGGVAVPSAWNPLERSLQ
ncbi:hypothetical protein EVAR_76830_1 [Eumeta japonica]|uniref:Uncharacterized protein n=1 Tax=Eumeta variegata TaxID=151549 RepID=A0A4C1Z1Z6_EUMVA|nr:hypothetical protein EVAR_76830_1 [Eumeta japonica]